MSLTTTYDPKTLQARFNSILASDELSLDKMNSLARELAAAEETHALVTLWDKMGGSTGADKETWVAVHRLHRKGKGNVPRGTLVVPAPRKRELAPQRRLHKICKGAVTKRRSDSANDHMVAACLYLGTLREATSAGGPLFTQRQLRQGELAKSLKEELGVSKDTARGLVTKLKQTKRGKELLFGA